MLLALNRDANQQNDRRKMARTPALELNADPPALDNPTPRSSSSQKHPKMARLRQRSCMQDYNVALAFWQSGTAAILCRAALSGIGATPGFFGNRPTGDPVGKSSIAIKWCRC